MTPSPSGDLESYAALWPVGFVSLSMAEVRHACVDAFPYSTTRPALANAFEEVLARLTIAGVKGELWLDGSFVTNKNDPYDVDFVLVADSQQYDSTPGIREDIDSLIEPVKDWPPPLADTNVMFRDPPETGASNFNQVLGWWAKRFSSHPSKGPQKGIVVVRLSEAEE